MITHHGQAKPTDIHIYLHGVGVEAPTEDRPRNRIGWLIPGIILGKILSGPQDPVNIFKNTIGLTSV